MTDVVRCFRNLLLAHKVHANAVGMVLKRAIVGPGVWNGLMMHLTEFPATDWSRIDDVSFNYYGVRVSGLAKQPDQYPLFLIEQKANVPEGKTA